MTTDAKLRHGTMAWFELVGTLLCKAALNFGRSPELNLSQVERYTDGVELSEGLVQGMRFDTWEPGHPSGSVRGKMSGRT
ncbi:MAG: hypothetical protein ABSC06_26200 [Rhodopila sp.]|jgi:hypothetical protein